MLDGEEKLVKSAVKGDSSAFGALYDHYQPMIYRFVVVKVGRREEAEDITHQVFMNAWQNIASYRHRGHPFSSWLYRIARNQVIDHYRARKEQISLEETNLEDLVVPWSASSDLGMKIEVEKVMQAVHALKPDYQDVVIMRFVEELSIKEAAKSMNKTEGAIKLIQHRAVQELKRILGEK